MRKRDAWMLASWSLVLLALATSSGCMGLAAQLMYVIKGHKTPAKFKGLEGQRVAVVCVSDAAAYGPDTLTYTINKAVSVKLANGVRKITVIPPTDIEKWMDVNGWSEHNFVEIGRGLKADKVVAVEVGSYSIREGSTLYKGRTNLTVTVYDIKNGGQVVYVDGPEEHTFPQNGRPAIQTTDRKFETLYLAKLTDHIARQFFDHDMLDSVAEDATMID